MKYETLSTNALLHSPQRRPEFRGNLFLGLLLGINFLIALPKTPACANTNSPAIEPASIQSQNGC